MRARKRFGIAMAAIIKIIAMTISNSMSEKPLCDRFINELTPSLSIRVSPKITVPNPADMGAYEGPFGKPESLWVYLILQGLTGGGCEPLAPFRLSAQPDDGFCLSAARPDNSKNRRARMGNPCPCSGFKRF